MPPLEIDEHVHTPHGEPEFESGQDLPPSALSRREFLHYGAAGIALASQALLGCTRAPEEKIVPYRVQPAGVVPGRPSHYATAATLEGYATGLLVESYEGRPTKIEGNPEHPASLGASSALEQALLLELYDPRRIRNARSTHDTSALSGGLDLPGWLRSVGGAERRGRGVHLVLPPQSSPLIAEQLAALAQRLPELTVHYHAPLSRAAVWAGAQRAFGTVLETRADLRLADVVVTLDADILAQGPNALPLARAFAERRAPSSGRGMNRLYAVETAMSITGQNADHRLAVPPTHVAKVAAALLGEVARSVGNPAADALRSTLATLPEASVRFVRALAADLLKHRGASAVFVGDEQPSVVHAAAHALNVLLGNAGTVLSYAPPVVLGSDDAQYGSFRKLRDALAAGAVESLIVFESDIAYASPADLGLRGLIAKAKESVSFGLFPTSTSAACKWEAPSAHVLESWLDTRAPDGTISIVQPLISPLYGGTTLSEVLSTLLGDAPSTAHDLVTAFWRGTHAADFESFWETTLAHGIVAGSGIGPVTVPALSWTWLPELGNVLRTEPAIELSLRRDSRVYDGRFANNPWLLELPEPVTKLTWENAACFGPTLARQLGISSGDVVRLVAGARSLEVPALIVPGHSEGAVGLTLGWGQDPEAGSERLGANGYRLLDSIAGHNMPVGVQRTGAKVDLAITQESMSLDPGGDSVLIAGTLHDYLQKAQKAARSRRQLSMYETEAPKTDRQWGMTIDLNACTGCSACVIACQAENNIPTVGKNGVLKRREMHWIRIDRYLDGKAENPRVLVQPMLCQHCEKAPCEYVCPTAATVHSSDGLNQMVYNRCVGTRFCSNNCPYKVRRFNWFNYHRDETSPRELAYNPEVTVRARGVMEKCTYCVQRIRTAEIRARAEHRPLGGQEVITACAQACPTRAIAFGNINDPKSEVAQLRKSDRAFDVLPELGARPRTMYLMRLSNPNPELA